MCLKQVSMPPGYVCSCIGEQVISQKCHRQGNDKPDEGCLNCAIPVKQAGYASDSLSSGACSCSRTGSSRHLIHKIPKQQHQCQRQQCPDDQNNGAYDCLLRRALCQEAKCAPYSVTPWLHSRVIYTKIARSVILIRPDENL